MTERLALAGDLHAAWGGVATVLAVASVVLLLVELARAPRRGGRARRVALTGVVAIACLWGAVVRPARVSERAARVGARVAILADASRSIDLPGDDGAPRREALGAALQKIESHYRGARVRTWLFGAPEPLRAHEPSGTDFAATPQDGSDLAHALGQLARGTEAPPETIVVVSDGRLDRPGAERTAERVKRAAEGLAASVHTVALAQTAPRDASIRKLSMAGAVVAHQPVSLSVEVACGGGLSCDDVLVVAKELHLKRAAVERARGTATVVDGVGKLDLEIELDRAGTRILEVRLEAPAGDAIPENDVRYLTIDVARDRVRLLHVAGRPTYDVRALRHWLKSDASVDVVAFFILRTHSDAVGAPNSELALIPFPVDELFTTHLPSFDAVVLQDFDAAPYGLSKHLRSLARYVERGGGLIMVGGPDAFVSGNYAGTPLASVLPISIAGVPREEAIDYASFVPRVTEAGRRAPVLEPLRSRLKGAWPSMPGTNVVGAPREGATVLLEHPTRASDKGKAMPVLALGEYGSGRSIALTVDGSHKLQFSTHAAGAAGRGHGAFWDAMLGWLMRDPRFEPVRMKLPHACFAGKPTTLSLRALFGAKGEQAEVEVARMGGGEAVKRVKVKLPAAGQPVEVPLGALAPGGYTASARLGKDGRSAPTRFDFACEVGGREWADSRPDPARLAAVAEALGGVAVDAASIDKLPQPNAAQVIAERRVSPLMPSWVWALTAALCVGLHWVVRRRMGLR